MCVRASDCTRKNVTFVCVCNHVFVLASDCTLKNVTCNDAARRGGGGSIGFGVWLQK